MTYNKHAAGITFGAFDLFHVGHIQFLKYAKECCEHLTVGLHVNPSIGRSEKNAPLQTLTERYMQLKACKYVDDIIPYETELDLTDILLLHPEFDIRFLGTDYKNKRATSQELVPILYVPRKHGFSSSSQRERFAGENK